MSGSPPKTPPYPHRALHPIAGFGVEPHHSFPISFYPAMGMNPEDTEGRAPPPPGFIYPIIQPDLVSLSYAPNELSASEQAPEQAPNEEETDEVSPKPKTYRWVGACSSSCSLPGALQVGHDMDGSPIYAGRAYHMGDMIPAKVIPSKQVAYISYGGEEIIKDQFEMLCPNGPQWVPCSDGLVVEGAVVAGTTADGENLYFGRVHHDGVITPGKVQVSHGCCYYPFNGAEMSSTSYEVLVIT